MKRDGIISSELKALIDRFPQISQVTCQESRVTHHAARFMHHSSFAPHVFESSELFQERQLNRACRAVALLPDDKLGRSLILISRVVELLSINETDDVAVLFNRAAFSEVRELWLVLGSLLGRA